MSTPTQAVTSLPDRIEELKAEQAALERAFAEDPFPTLDTIDNLKRQKLRIRDELYQLERQRHPAALGWRGSGSVNMTGRPRVRGGQSRRP